MKFSEYVNLVLKGLREFGVDPKKVGLLEAYDAWSGGISVTKFTSTMNRKYGDSDE